MTYKEDAKKAVLEVIEASKIKKGELFVVGCSSSEIIGKKIGTDSYMRFFPKGAYIWRRSAASILTALS